MGSVKTGINLLTFFILLLSVKGWGQEMPDSLIIELERTYNKERQLEILREIVEETFKIRNSDTTIYFAKKKRDLAQMIGNKKRYAGAMWKIALSYKRKNDFHNASSYLFKTLLLFENLGNNEGVAAALYNIGQVFKKGNDFEKGISYLQKSLDIYQLIGEDQLEAKTHYEIARGYLETGDHEKSFFHLSRCIKLNDIDKNQGLTSKAYNHLGINYYKLKLYDKAIEEYSRARQYAIGLEDYDKKSAIAYNNIGEVYVEKGDYEKAWLHYQKALNLKRQLGDQELLAGTLINLGKLALLECRPSEAIPYLEEITCILDKDRLNDNLTEASILLAEAYKSKQDFTMEDLQKVMALNKQYAQHIHDLKQNGFQQWMTSTISKNMLESEAAYLEEKARNTHNFSLWIIGISLIVIAGFLVLLYYRERKFKLFIQKMWEDIKDI